ncbi:hypothetical protein ACFLSJ_05375, partial [Verrucomicrobiota bacterium]
MLTPLWLICFSPLVLLFPVPALPFLLGFTAFAAFLYRAVCGFRRRFFAGAPGRLERFLILAAYSACLLVFFQVNIVHDAFQYYGYVASVAIDHDLNLYDEIYLNNAYRFYNP